MKKLIALSVAAIILLTAGVAMASSPEVKLDGDLKVHYRWNSYDWKTSDEGGKVYFRLNAKAALSDNVDAYARFATQKLTADHVGADFYQQPGYYAVDSATEIDRFGLIFKNNGFTYNVGRQAATLGATGLILSTESYLGNYWGSFDGIQIDGKIGATTVKILAGEEPWTKTTDNKVYAVQANYDVTPKLNVGAVLGKYKWYYGSSVNYWVANATYKAGKAGYVAEYGKSNADNDNTAYVVGATYKFDTKNSAYTYYSKVEVNADMGMWTEFDAEGKGIYLGYDHKLRKDTTMGVFYKFMKDSDGGSNTDYDSFRLTMTYKF